jgi:hypothetical protein
MRKLLGLLLALLVACGTPTPTATVTPPPRPSPARTATQASSTPSATPPPTATPPASATPPPTVQPRPVFAPYEVERVTVIPALRQEPIDPDMGNVLVPLVLSPEQLEQLAAAGVVASPSDYPEFHDLYRETTSANLPVFVTSDALLHAFHLTFDATLLSLEEHVFLPHLQAFNQALLAQADAYYQQLSGTAWEDSARRVAAFVAVGGKLADPAFPAPDYTADLVEAELALINEAAGPPRSSPIFPLLRLGEDYTQYLPRGHYTRSDPLKAYFRAMMWYGRMTFRPGDPEDPEVGPAETRMALLLALAVRDGAAEHTALDLWSELYDPTAFLVGRSDDLTIHDYLGVMEAVYGPGAEVGDIADESRLETFIAATADLPAPRILGLISADWKPLEAVKGLRLMGQRFVPDAYIFQNLIHPRVPGRYLPSGLDVMAVMGSERAAGWLAQDANNQDPAYAVNTGELIGWLGSLPQSDWTETSYNAWLYTLRPLLTPPGEGYPLFMQSTAWQDKQLNTALGSWAELKHDTILYAKQAVGGLGGGCDQPRAPSPVRAQNYVERVPEVFARLAALARMTRVGLEQRGLLQLIPVGEGEFPLSYRLDLVTGLALAFKGMAEKELAGTPLTLDEQAQLRSFGNFMENVVDWANGDAPELEPAAVIADVATDPNTRQVLEVGVGSVHEVFAVAPIPQADGTLALTVARGGIFSYYEFPSDQRLTDELWRAQLSAGEAPAQPAFTGGFSVPQAASPEIQAALYGFQLGMVDWLYFTVGSGEVVHDCAPITPPALPQSGEVRQQVEAAVAALRAQKQYEGRQWINTDYVSVEFASPDLVTVTVRETWSDYLVTYEGDNPFDWHLRNAPEPITARRGPYTIDVTYALERLTAPDGGVYWNVVSMTELTPRPAWAQP